PTARGRGGRARGTAARARCPRRASGANTGTPPARSCSRAVAAPVFSEVVQQTLRIMGVQPDMAVKPAIVAEQVEESF
ncbi:hypothetical protein EO238_33165, partial [Citrobacter sp. AAK_AS5]